MPRRTLLASALGLAVIAAGCSDDDATFTTEPSTTDPAGSTSSTTPTATSNTSTSTTTVSATTTTPSPSAASYAERGPYAVGVATIDIGDRMSEVYYPASPESGTRSEFFDVLEVFPEDLQPRVPEEPYGLVDTSAYRDAPPLADVPERGFPILVYSHGIGGFRQMSTFHTTHVASWGHVVISTDHLERGLAAQATDTLGGGAENQDVLDVLTSIDAVVADDRFAPMADLERVAITGHAAGAGTSARAAAEDLIDGYISISGGAPETVVQKPAVVVIGELDEVVPADRSYGLFDQLDDAVLVNVADAGHNSFTDSCRGIRNVGGLDSLSALIGADQVGRVEDGCAGAFVEPEAAQAALNHYTVHFLFTLFADDPPGPAVDISGELEVDDLDEAGDETVAVVLADFQAG